MPSKPTAKFAQFTHATDAAKPRLIWSSVGEIGTRKTSFGLEGPGPVFVQSLDRGLEGVIEPYQVSKDIYYKEYKWSPGAFDTDEEAQEAAIALRDDLTADMMYALENGIRTGLWDKETAIWELFRYAEFGAPNDAPRNYPKLNQRYRHWLNLPKDYDCNWGFIQSMKDEWVTVKKKDGSGDKGSNTGRRIAQGFGELGEIVHIDLLHRRVTEEIEGEKKTLFYVDVGKSRGPGAREVQGQTFENLTFVELAMMIFPETTEEDWQ